MAKLFTRQPSFIFSLRAGKLQTGAFHSLLVAALILVVGDWNSERKPGSLVCFRC
jgi:hypothetical protein